MGNDAVKSISPLGFPWETSDPFLFCVYHNDAYPSGNDQMGPAASLAGRNMGQDFTGKDGWRMYHGETVPGFPQHPHRGFETVTVVRRGVVDHSDSLGATARFGQGDAQWLTAGKGIVHAEMFPLRDRSGANPLDLFQIWLNLPPADKFADPHFAMLWADEIPRHVATDDAGRRTEVTLVAGIIGDLQAPAPPPSSWASRADSDVAIWTVTMAPHAEWILPAARPGTNRTLYFFRGESLHIGGTPVTPMHAVGLQADVEVRLQNGAADCEFLMLQGRPIGAPVAQHGPFVMNTPE
ncbi:MAG: pirin family protein, partial [Candidatus Sericytochromatia bacterium]|nr:pirin family protein [Candidatus Sericytochromatia bacterium]